MATEIKVPSIGTGTGAAIVIQWLCRVGDGVATGEPLVVLESFGVEIPVTAPANGVLESIAAPPGSGVHVGSVLGVIEP